MSSSDRLRRQSTICAIVTTASLAATLISTVPASAESAEEKYDLKLGKISHNVFDWSVQPVSVKNTTGVVADIKVECGFYSGDTLLGAGTITIPLIKPSQVAYGDVSSTMEGAIKLIAASSVSGHTKKTTINDSSQATNLQNSPGAFLWPLAAGGEGET